MQITYLYFNQDISGRSNNKKIGSDQSQTPKQTGSAQLNQHDHIKWVVNTHHTHTHTHTYYSTIRMWSLRQHTREQTIYRTVTVTHSHTLTTLCDIFRYVYSPTNERDNTDLKVQGPCNHVWRPYTGTKKINGGS